jgi:hypothetical protein
VRFAPNDKLAITPRITYQKVDMDGWNRIDDYNILANPFTTTRPAVTLANGSSSRKSESRSPTTISSATRGFAIRFPAAWISPRSRRTTTGTSLLCATRRR